MQQVNQGNKSALQKMLMQAQATQNIAAFRQIQANPFVNPFILNPMAAQSQSIAGQSFVQAANQVPASQQTVYIGDLPKDVSMVELYEYIRKVAGECELVLKR